MIKDLVTRSRSIRRFHQDVPVSRESLAQLVDLARLSPSGANLQPLKYILIADPALCAKVFPYLAWAGYLKDWPGPVQGERPAAYIVVLGDKRIRPVIEHDAGIAVQSIRLGATEMGWGGCIIQSIQRRELRLVLEIPEDFEILLVLALGKPKETVVLEPMGPDGDVQYWRDAEQVHHVPKRALDDIIVR
ncbi:MAG: nitroreductase family protein [Gemmatimonadota bacterium]